MIRTVHDITSFYGRASELETLQRSFRKATKLKRPELVTIGGVSGAGKSRLVSSFCGAHVGKKAFVCSGKCDPSRSQEPFSSVVDALQELCSTLVDAENSQEIVKDIKEALGDKGTAVLMSVIPGLSRLLGEEPSNETVAVEDDSSIARDRLKNLVRGFIQSVTKTKAVVLVCDDAQWIDASSLRVLTWLMTDPLMNGLLVLVTYRENEVSPEHPFIKELELLKERKTRCSHIALKNLTNDELNPFIANVLGSELVRTEALSRVVYEKTHGNIFFVMQFLQELEKRRMLSYSVTNAEWTWSEPERIRSDTSIANNVVNLVANKIKDLAPDVQMTVKMASCISCTVSRSLLSRIMRGLSLEAAEGIDKSLEKAREEGLLVLYEDRRRQGGSSRSADVRYKFAHDRIQQAAYTLVGNGFEADLLHFRIGQQVLDHMYDLRWNEGEREKGWIRFVAADQMHRGRSCITKDEDRVLLASLNLTAGKKAMDIAAFSQASQYFTNAIAVLKQVEGSWEKHHDLMIALHQNLADAWWCFGDPRKSEKWVETVIKRAKSMEERVPASVTLAQVLGVQQKHSQATSVEVKELQGLQVFPRSFKGVKGVAWLLSMKKRLSKIGEADVLALPMCTNERIKIAAKLLTLLAKHATYDGDDVLQVLAIVLNVRLTLEYGVNRASVSAFAQIGTLVAVFFGDAKEGHRLGKISIALMKKLQYFDTFTVLIAFKYCCAWYIPLTDTTEPLLEGYTKGMKQGQVEMAFVCFNFYLVHCFMSGLSLGPLIEDAKAHDMTMAEFGIYATLMPLRVIRQTFLNLAGRSVNAKVLTGDAMNEKEFFEGDNSTLAFCHFYLFKMQLAYYFQDYELADEMRTLAWKNRKASIAFCQVSTLMYFSALIPLAITHSTRSSQHKRRARAAINTLRKAVSKEHKGINLIHKLYLLNAEYLALNSSRGSKEIRQAYDRAITMANRAGVRQDSAIGNLRAGIYCLERDSSWASHYFTRSVNLFQEWGAHGVAKHLRSKYRSMIETSTRMSISTDHKGRQRHSEISALHDLFEASADSAFLEADDPTEDSFTC